MHKSLSMPAVSFSSQTSAQFAHGPVLQALVALFREQVLAAGGALTGTEQNECRMIEAGRVRGGYFLSLTSDGVACTGMWQWRFGR